MLTPQTTGRPSISFIAYCLLSISHCLFLCAPSFAANARPAGPPHRPKKRQHRRRLPKPQGHFRHPNRRHLHIRPRHLRSPPIPSSSPIPTKAKSSPAPTPAISSTWPPSFARAPPPPTYYLDLSEHFTRQTWDFQHDPDDFTQAIRFAEQARQLLTSASPSDSPQLTKAQQQITRLQADRKLWQKEMQTRAELNQLELAATLDQTLTKLRTDLDSLRTDIDELRTGSSPAQRALTQTITNLETRLADQLLTLRRALQDNQNQINDLWDEVEDNRSSSTIIVPLRPPTTTTTPAPPDADAKASRRWMACFRAAKACTSALRTTCPPYLSARIVSSVICSRASTLRSSVMSRSMICL